MAKALEAIARAIPACDTAADGRKPQVRIRILGNRPNEIARKAGWIIEVTLARTAPDLDFQLTRTLSLVVAFVPLVVMPVGLLATGLFVWRRRRMR